MTNHQKRWHKTPHTGVSTDKDGHILVRAAIKRKGKHRQRKSVLPPGTTIGEALLVYANLKRELEGGHSALPRETVADCAERWIVECSDRMRPRVVETRLQTLSDHVLPEIGHIYIDDLTHDQIVAMTRKWINKVKPEGKGEGQPYARATISFWFRVTRLVVRHGCAVHQCHDPTANVKLPRVQRPKMREQKTLTKEQVKALLDLVQRLRPRRYAEVCLLVQGGLRPSELNALNWADINFGERTVTINKGVDRGHIDGTKVERSDRPEIDGSRSPVLPRRSMRALRAHREWMVSTNYRWLSTGLVFPSNRGTHRFPSSLSKVFKLAEESLGFGVHITPQVLRRTCNTLLQAAGVDPITIRAMMGHSGEQMTELYTHVSRERMTEAADLHGAFLGDDDDTE